MPSSRTQELHTSVKNLRVKTQYRNLKKKKKIQEGIKEKKQKKKQKKKKKIQECISEMMDTFDLVANLNHVNNFNTYGCKA